MPRLRRQVSRRWEAAFGLPLAFVLGLAAMPDARRHLRLPAQAATTAPLVRVAAPFEGSQARLGDDVRKGARRAVAAINAAGGIAGQKVAFETVALACGASAPAAPPASPGPVLVILPACAGRGAHPAPGTTVLAIAGRVDALAAAALPAGLPRLPASRPSQGETAARFLLDRHGAGPLVIVSDGTRFGRGWAAQARSALQAAGAPPPVEFDLIAGAKDYSALARRIANTAPAGVLLAVFPAEAAILIGSLADSGVSAALAGMDVLAADTFPRLAGANAGRIAFPLAPTPGGGGRRAEGLAYAGVEAWAQALRAEPAKPVSETWRMRAAATIAGRLRFNDDGEPTLPAFVMTRWVDGRLKAVADDGARP